MSTVAIQSASFSLKDIILAGFEYKLPDTWDNQGIFSIGRFATANPPTDQIRMGVHISIRSGESAGDAFGALECHFIFGVKNLAAFRVEENSERYAIPSTLLTTLFSIAYSTARGIWFAKGMGTILHLHIPPVIDPSEVSIECQIDNEPWTDSDRKVSPGRHG